MKFKLETSLRPKGDQPSAIEELSLGGAKGKQTLLGVTGSGKTFTIANVINKIQKPTLVISHNKTLAAQLCNEFREFFPHNAVEYFVSYYDYYQPETYMVNTDTYIEKEAQINQEIDRLRHASTQSLSTRKDVIIVSSVSCIYGLGSPEEYKNTLFELKVNQKIDRKEVASKLIDMQFERVKDDLRMGTFRLRGQTLEIMPVNKRIIYRIDIGGKINLIETIDPIRRNIIEENKIIYIFPSKHYVISEQRRKEAIEEIRSDLADRLSFFEKSSKKLEYERLKKRVNYDLEMIENIGYCHGIENYSRHFDGRSSGEPPFTLIDYFKEADKDFLTVIDESHVTIPQIGSMYEGDKSRKKALIDHGFRLESAYDNRPLKYNEFEKMTDNIIYVSATPKDFELNKSKKIVEQIVRPTGLIDPEVIIKPINGKVSQVDDLIINIIEQVTKKEKTLVTTLTKRMAEDLTGYLEQRKIKVKYIHSDIKTLERIEIITELRKGLIDVIVGVNLLREGLDIPEVSLVAILDADKEGFLRNETSLIQTIGRAARNVNGRVILYADKNTKSIDNAIKETNRRRKIQLKYNKDNNITPKTIEKSIKNILEDFGIESKRTKTLEIEMVGDDIKETIKEKKERMKEAAEKLEFELALILREEILILEKKYARENNNKRSKRA
ncbi:MAG: excinuclease ABC subunit UvrB [Candidatus Pacebacteria bacterium]|nr:excinuclease ABC subunit UvrB [Candidatus Paceibacterota bacterium]MDD2757010.1 excinuclease ABC subunit UvrB [Candidatus Paceibacterota bacterium]MDD3283520.1 excinuclease ABC subunit UvrB [Candidatus Paceibacterota bacterium]MDD3969624.1 excinuclease ABC subunit UvrB [Candidatus Paceibacterota bacterium]MDD4737830.1 excinuclease ABC subunit UvrB [Candidatus Paceibacterota bacterium]